MKLRWDVFVEEQGTAEHEEVDGEDGGCTHVLANFDGLPIGAARFQYIDEHARIQRVCVVKEYRGRKIGADMIKFIVDQVLKGQRSKAVRLGAQTHAVDFYKRLGFFECEGEYLDAGIWHKDMEILLT